MPARGEGLLRPALATGPAVLRFSPALFLLLAACGSSDNDPGPGGVSVGEAKALDEAAEMLEQQRLKPEDVPQPSDTPSAQPTG